MSGIDGSGADQQLASYVDRLLRAVEGTEDLQDPHVIFSREMLRTALSDPYARIAACVAAVGKYPKVRAGRKVWWRGVYCSSKVLGCVADDGAVIMRRAARLLPMDGYWAKIAAECPASAVGHVYVVECPEFPGVVKVGFSSQFAKRLEQLKREYKVDLEVKSLTVGTYLDEYVAQRALGQRWLVGEWFGSAEAPQFCPAFIKAARGAPVREIAEGYLARLGKPGPIPNTGPFRSPIEVEADERKQELH